MRTLWERFVGNESGATAIEYAFIAGLISIAIIAALDAIALDLNGTFGNAAAPL